MTEVYNLTIDDVYFDGMTSISLVDFPAIEESWVYFSKSYKFQDVDSSKHVITGPILIPDKEIERYDYMGEKYIVKFSADEIEKIHQKYMKESRLNNVNMQHSVNVNDVYIFEIWQIADEKEDKATALGFNLPKGTLMVSMKVNNDDVWNRIIDGDLRGFSIEGFFSHILLQNQDFRKQKNEDIDNLIKQLSDINN